MLKILVLGGGGYVGSHLVPRLLIKGYIVTVYDLFIYGEKLIPNNKNLININGDIRDIQKLKKIVPGNDIIIHLACISNDPSFELNPILGKSINLDSFLPIVKIAKKFNVKRFIYASSSSVYGIKKTNQVHENMDLNPLTDYSRFKADCEKILLENLSEKFTVVILRPATVCGYAPRQRMDVVVNIFTNLAYHNRLIIVNGGDQLRPNIHIEDMARAYLALIEAPKELIHGEIFNVGEKNFSLRDIANQTKKIIGDDVKVLFKPTNDNRSYKITSQKIRDKLGFKTDFTIVDAIKDLKIALETNKLKIVSLIHCISILEL